MSVKTGPRGLPAARDRGAGRSVGTASPHAAGDMPAGRPGRRSRGWVGVVAGVLVAIAVAVAGAVLAASQPPQWTAETRMLVGPGAQADTANISAYYETLSRGQVTATAAEIVGEPHFTKIAATATGVRDPDRVTTQVAVVPGTSLLSISATAPSRLVAERLADEVARVSTPTVNRLLTPYAASSLGSADNSAEPSGLSPAQVYALVGLAAVGSGIGVQQLARQVGARRRHSRSART